jgi:hypothetical protein
VGIAKLDLKNPPDLMKARILFLAGSLVLTGCKEPQVSSDQSQMTTPAPSPRVLYYLSRRVAVASEESLYGLEAGTELKLIEARPGRLLVEAQGMQFEIDQREVIHDREQAERLRARAEKEKEIQRVAIGWHVEDRKFLAEENIRRSAAEQIAHLRNAIGSARAEISRLEARHSRTALEGLAATPSEDRARRQRISTLQAYIADCDREIQILSEAIPAAE